MRYSQLKEGMYIYDADKNLFTKIIALRFYRRSGRICHRTMAGNYTKGGWQRYKLVFGRHSLEMKKCRFKHSFGCPFKKEAKLYGCKDGENVRYYCQEVPMYAEKLVEVNKLAGMIRIGE